MKMRYAMVLAAGLAFNAGAALAITPDEVVAELQAQGYTRVEVKIFDTQIKVEAIRGTDKLEVIYDKATGAVLKSEVQTVGLFENTTPGVEIRDRSNDDGDDGIDDDSNDDDNSGVSDDDDDDSNDDHSGSDDDSNDDHSGSDDDGSDDDSGDDDGGDDDSGDDDHGGDSGHDGDDD